MPSNMADRVQVRVNSLDSAPSKWDYPLSNLLFGFGSTGFSGLAQKISSVTLIEIDDILNIKHYGLDIKFAAAFVLFNSSAQKMGQV